MGEIANDDTMNRMGKDRCYLAIDLGAGSGTRVALFTDDLEMIAEDELSSSEYKKDFEAYADALETLCRRIMKHCAGGDRRPQAVGIATAGILRTDGSFKLIQNIPNFNGKNLRAEMEKRFDVPAGIANDADAGALAEWSVRRYEILYWVFGGGWGGAWVSDAGEVRFPSTDWDGRDETLHYTNEPGYALPLDKMELQILFREVNASFERFVRILVDDLGERASVGPCDNRDTLRAETILSGPGRCRLFRAIVGDDEFYERFLDIHETKNMSDPAIAGRYISKLSGMRVEAAVNTDRLYGKVLAHATRTMFRRARLDGLRDGTPICLGGKPSYALPYFGPSAQRALGKMGIMSYLRPSVVDDRGVNANLMGAAVVAQKLAPMRTVAAGAAPVRRA